MVTTVTPDNVQRCKELAQALADLINQHVTSWREDIQDPLVTGGMLLNAIANLGGNVCISMSPDYEDIAMRLCHSIMGCIAYHKQLHTPPQEGESTH